MARLVKTKDMTEGNAVKLILGFALPVLLGNLLQQLYNLIDSLIVGRLLGVTALAAVSASGWLDWAVLSVPMGIAQGFSIHAAQCYGARRYEELKRTVAQSYMIAVTVTVILELVSQLFLHPVLLTMRTPDETIVMTENYLRIIYAGLPVVMAVNAFSGFLHALGDSRTPLIALACASAVNIVLDWLFVGPLGLGTNGGALATVAAQTVSTLICLAAVLKIPELIPAKKDYAPDRPLIKKLMKLGFPIAFQNLIIAAGGLILQSVVNSFGFVFMAGYTAASRLQGLVEMAGSSLGSATGTFTGQNYGAAKMRRVRLGLTRSAQIAIGLSVTVGLIVAVFARPILSLFIRADESIAGQVLTTGCEFLRVMAAGLPILYLLFVYRFTLQGLGDTVVPMLSGVIELGMRVGAAFLLPLLLGMKGVYFAEVSAWAGAGIFLIAGCYRRLRRIEHRGR